MVILFKYIGQVISEADYDWSAVVKNLFRATKFWRRIPHILRREGSAPRVSGFFFKAVLQAVLIFGS